MIAALLVTLCPHALATRAPTYDDDTLDSTLFWMVMNRHKQQERAFGEPSPSPLVGALMSAPTAARAQPSDTSYAVALHPPPTTPTTRATTMLGAP